jgi:hypothetical protein
MGSLQDAIEAGTESSATVSGFLRKCIVIAYRIGSEEFKQWIDHELNGYGDHRPLPPYRVEIPGHLRAQVAGPFGSGYKNIQVPESLLGKHAKHWVNFQLTEGVGFLESLVENAGDRMLQRFLPPEIFAQITIVEGHATMEMWSGISSSSIKGVLDQIRNRALGFLLDLERIDPNAGEPGGAAIKASSLQALFRRHFFG